MIQYALHESSYLDAAKYYHEIWETPIVKEDATGKGREVSGLLDQDCWLSHGNRH